MSVSNVVKSVSGRCCQNQLAVATCEVKEKDIKPVWLRNQRRLDEVGFQSHMIAPYKVMKTPP